MLRLLATAYFEWDCNLYLDKALKAISLANQVVIFFFPFVEKYFFVCRSRATASYVLIVRSFDDGLTKISQMCELIKAGSWGNHKATAKAQRIK